MLELWLIRHGQTHWNVEGRYQGQADIPLNETGWEQARLLAQSLQGKSFDAIYSSDLSRAYQTAVEIAKVTGLPVLTDRRLREICQGEWEGQTIAEINQRFAKEIENQRIDPLHARAPGGESAVEVAARMADFANEIAQRHPHQRVLIVSHGFALATLICQAHHIPLEQVSQHIPQNASPVVIYWTPGMQNGLKIRPFSPEDQERAKELILQGMESHWGVLDPTLNTDLNDISASYQQGFFFTGFLGGRLVVTGALVPRSHQEAEIVRMSVARDLQRQGIGKRMLTHLLNTARQKGYRQVILETTATWEEVIAFYLDAGFRITHEKNGDVYFLYEFYGT